MKGRNATASGFLVAPLVPVIVGAAINPPTMVGNLALFAGMVAIVYVYAGMLTALLGVPLYFVLRKFNVVRWWSTLLAGGVIGLLAAVLLRLPVVVLSLEGGLGGLVFWVVWRTGSER